MRRVFLPSLTNGGESVIINGRKKRIDLCKTNPTRIDKNGRGRYEMNAVRTVNAADRGEVNRKSVSTAR